MPEQSCIILDNNWTFFLIRPVGLKETWWFCCQSLWNECLTHRAGAAHRKKPLSHEPTHQCRRRTRKQTTKGVKNHIKYEKQATPSVTSELPGEKGACQERREPAGSPLPFRRSGLHVQGPCRRTDRLESEFCLLPICAMQAQGIKVFLKAGD